MNARAAVALMLFAGAAQQTPVVTVTIPRGATLAAAVDSLTVAGVIGHPTAFLWYARLRGLRGGLKSGTYAFRTTDGWGEVVRALERGRGTLVSWTVPEGLMLTEVAARAEQDLGIPRDSFLLAASDPAVLAAVGIADRADNAEGYLYPTTYTLRVHVGARELVQAMVAEFLTHWQPQWTARLDSLHLTRHQLVTLASIVQAEVRYPPDRPYIAAVYANRLRRGMKLEADPTVIYAYGRRLHRVFEKNLRVASAYNTYQHAGLPPGPICQPDSATIAAALYPAPVPFLFFVAQPDGKHVFSTTLAEHEAAIRRIRSAPQRATGQPSPGH